MVTLSLVGVVVAGLLVTWGLVKRPEPAPIRPVELAGLLLVIAHLLGLLPR